MGNVKQACNLQKTGASFRNERIFSRPMNFAQHLRRFVGPTFAVAVFAALLGAPILSLAQGQPPAAPPAGSTQARERARANAMLNNTKQIALGCVMYLQDYDEKYPKGARTYNTVVLPYVRNKAAFTSPMDKPGTISLRFNPNLAGKGLANVNVPSRMVMLYEGGVKNRSSAT